MSQYCFEAYTLDDEAGLRVVIDIPFELQSLAEAELEISASLLRLRGPSGEEVVASVPEGTALDPQRATAKFSRKKRQLSVSSPDVGPGVASRPARQSSPKTANTSNSQGYPRNDGTAKPTPTAPSASEPPQHQQKKQQQEQKQQQPPTPQQQKQVKTPQQQQQQQQQQATKKDSNVPDRAFFAGRNGINRDAAVGDDDDDDDDLPPPLEQSAPKPSQAPDVEEDEEDADPDVVNEAADAMMQQAIRQREKKQVETEKARKKFDGGGLKKGFFSSAPSKKEKKSTSADAAKKSAESKAPAKEEIPFITGAADPHQARLDSLKLPEVQAAIKQQTEKIKTDNSWCTPQLMQALGARPDLMKGLQNPRVMEAFSMMQKDPEEAKKRYSSDPEVTAFLKEFSGLMATHFDVLSKDAGKSEPSKPQASMQTPVQTAAGLPAPIPIEKPEVEAALRDPEVQHLISELQRGRPLEMKELAGRNPRLFMKVKVLLDNGLLAMQT